VHVHRQQQCHGPNDQMLRKAGIRQNILRVLTSRLAQVWCILYSRRQRALVLEVGLLCSCANPRAQAVSAPDGSLSGLVRLNWLNGGSETIAGPARWVAKSCDCSVCLLRKCWSEAYYNVAVDCRPCLTPETDFRETACAIHLTSKMLDRLPCSSR
jgi:hypothetical protein